MLIMLRQFRQRLQHTSLISSNWKSSRKLKGIYFSLGIGFLTSFGASPVLAQTPGYSPPAPNSAPPPAPITGRVVERRNLQKMAMDIPEVKTHVQGCLAKAMQNNGGQQITGEMYENAKDQCFQEAFSKVPPQQAKALIEKMGNLETESQENLRYESGPAFQGLQEYLSKRLREALYGDLSVPEKKFVDHTVFYELFKTQVGKNIISTLSSYCVNADESGLVAADSALRKETRMENLKKLNETVKVMDASSAASQKSNSGMNSKQGMDENAGYLHFQRCIMNISNICLGNKYTQKLPDGSSQTIDYNDAQAIFGRSDDDPDVIYTRQQACIVNRELKRARKELLEIQNIQKKIAELQKDQGQGGTIQVQGFKGIYGGGDANEKTIDDLTTITSNEFVNKSNMGKALRGQAFNFERECLRAVTPKCQEMLNNNKDYANFNKIKDEYNAQTEIVKSKIMGMTDAEVSKFLLAEGRSNQEVQLILQKSRADQNAVALRERIAKAYAKEREAIIKGLAQRVNESNLQMGHTKAPQPGGQAATAAANPQDTKGMLEKIYDKLNSQEGEIRDTILFNNIVSGYLGSTDQKGMTTRNSAQAYREINDNAYDPTKNKFAPMAGSKASERDASIVPPAPEKKEMVDPKNPTANNNTVTPTPKPVPTLDPQFFQELQANTRKNLPMAPNSKSQQQTTIEVPTLNQILGSYIDEDSETNKQIDNLHDQQRKQDISKRNAENKQPNNINPPPPQQLRPEINRPINPAPAVQPPPSWR